MAGRNKRRYARQTFTVAVQVAWQDPQRNEKVAVTRSFDLSETGMRFEVPEPLEMRSDVMLRAAKIGLQTRAVVRFCEPKGFKYVVGVEFAGSYRWQPPNDEIRAAIEAQNMIAVL